MTNTASSAPPQSVDPDRVRVPLGRGGECPDPVEALGRLEGLSHRVLLESRGPGGRHTFLSAAPRATARVGGEQGSDPFEALRTLLAPFEGKGPAAPPARPDGRSPVRRFPFAGAIAGFLGYESARFLERLPDPVPDDIGMPDAWFGVYDWALVWDRERGAAELCGTVLPGGDRDELRARMEEVALRLEGRRGSGPRTPEAPGGGSTAPPAPAVPSVHSSLDREAFMAGVERIREYIRRGDLFQANLTRRIDVASPVSGSELYRRLAAESPAPFGAYLDTGDGEVVSISPEGFLSVRGRKVLTRPIKGTAPRAEDATEDRRLAEGLTGSEKDRAENVMIVDLLRSDLSRVCEDGSVAVPELLALESHPTVHHLVSSVRGRLRDGVGPVDLLRATFPGGSVTGAPKIRAMEILGELEPVRRGVYTGALGVIGFEGDMELSIPIRTAVCRGGRVHYGTGGGITLASDPAAEWAESEDKARAFLRAVGVPA